MANTFNLNISDYNINELKDLLNLRDPYTLEDIVKNEDNLREKLLLDGTVSIQKKKEIIVFLESVKEILLNKGKEAFKNMEHSEIINNEHSIIGNSRTIIENINSAARDSVATGVKKTTINKLLCVDSKFRDNYYTTLSTNYTATLPTTIKNVVSMELAALEIPGTYYQISKSKGNNFFWVKTCDTPSNWFYISIPDGNYLRPQMEEAVNNQLKIANTTCPSGCPQIKIDQFTIKTVFSINDISLNNFELHFNRENSGYGATRVGSNQPEPGLNKQGYGGIIGGFGWLMGFRMGSYTGSTAYVSEGCYDAWGTKYLYIIVNDFNKNVNNFCIPAYNESLGKTNILARVSTNAVSSKNFSNGLSLTNDTIGSDDSMRTRIYFGPVNISRLELQIVDEFGMTVDLNNMDYSMSLNLTCLYD
mgnify:CR=1 FL=1|tara:strand:+ start:9335 stop:10591 length:1257 start_codon:yes stop_codon:yes gene_type:complete